MTRGGSRDDPPPVDLEKLLATLRQFGVYYEDLLTFYLAPGRYLRTVAQESGGRTAVRLCVYAVSFTFIELSLFIPFIAHPVGIQPLALVGATVLETALGVTYVPAFVATALVARFEHPLKIALTYALTFRFALLPVPVVLYALFWATEDYGYALVRGIAFYLLFAGQFVVLPVATSATLRRRALALFVCVVGGIGTYSALDAINSATATESSQLWRFTLLYDPIGDEVDRAGFRFYPPDPKDEIGKVMSEIEFLAVGADSMHPTPRELVEDSRAALRSKWSQLSARLSEQVLAEATKFRMTRDSAMFSTTRGLVDLKLRELDATKSVIGAIGSYVSSPKLGTQSDLFQAYSDLQKVEIEGLRRLGGYQQVRARLVSHGMLIA